MKTRKLTSVVLTILFITLSMVNLAGVHIHHQHHDGNVHLALHSYHQDTNKTHDCQSDCNGESPLEHILEHKVLVKQDYRHDSTTSAMVLPQPVILSSAFFTCCRIHVYCNTPHAEYYQPVLSDRAPPA